MCLSPWEHKLQESLPEDKKCSSRTTRWISRAHSSVLSSEEKVQQQQQLCKTATARRKMASSWLDGWMCISNELQLHCVWMDFWKDCLSWTFATFGAKWQNETVENRKKLKDNWLSLDCCKGGEMRWDHSGRSRGEHGCFSVGMKFGFRKLGRKNDCLAWRIEKCLEHRKEEMSGD